MKIAKLYLEVNDDEVEVGRSILGFGFRSVSTLSERPVHQMSTKDPTKTLNTRSGKCRESYQQLVESRSHYKVD